MKTIKILIVALLLTTSTSLMAQNKLGYLNSGDVISSMPEMDSINNKLKSFEKELTDTFDAMQAEYSTKAAEFQKKSAEWTEAMQTQKVKELNSLRDNIQSFQEAAQTEGQKKSGELMEPVFKKIQDAINAVGKENGFTYIFDTRIGALIYIDEATAVNALPLVKAKLGIKN